MQQPQTFSVMFLGNSCQFCSGGVATTTAPVTLVRRIQGVASQTIQKGSVDTPACKACRRRYDSVASSQAMSARRDANTASAPSAQHKMLGWLVTLSAGGSGVAVVVLTENGWLALLAAVAVLVIGVYLATRVARRVEPDPDPDRQAALEHLGADRQQWRAWASTCKQVVKSLEFRDLRKQGWKADYPLFPQP